jgi:hypothetical protein
MYAKISKQNNSDKWEKLIPLISNLHIYNWNAGQVKHVKY